MTTEPSTTVSNDRNPDGTFSRGNRAARGNPWAKRVAQLRSALMRSVKTADVQRTVRALVAQAEAGDTTAIKVLFDRVLGPAIPADVIERLSELEARVEELIHEHKKSN